MLALIVQMIAAFGIFPHLFLAQGRVLFGLVVILCPVSIAWLCLEADYYQVHLRPMLERDLGFQYTKCMEQITIAHVQPGGLFDRAGFQEMDVVIDGDSITGFFRKLEMARGKDPISITVVPWSVSIPIKDRPKRQLTVSVPPRDFDAAMSRELGFRCAVRYLEEGDKWIGVLAVTEIQPGGPFDRGLGSGNATSL